MKDLKICPLSQGKKHGSMIQTESQGIEEIPKERRNLEELLEHRMSFCRGGFCMDLGRLILSLV